MSERPPDLLIEQHLLGELPPHQRDRVERWLQTPEGAQALDALRASNQDILRAHPPARLGALIADQAPPPSPARRFALPALALALVALIAVAVWPRDAPHAPSSPPTDSSAMAALTPDGDEENTRDKGGDAAPQLIVYRADTSRRLTRLAHRDAARSRDLLQLAYRAGDAQHGVILSIDGRGAVSLHFPQQPQGDTRLDAGEARLSHAYELDDAPRFERFFLITASDPIDVALVEAAAQKIALTPHARDAPLSLPSHLRQQHLTLFKVGDAP